MKRVFTSTCLAILCAAGLAAQTPAGEQRKAESARPSDDKSATIVGCLRAGPTPNTFVLANVKDESPTEPSSTPPTPPPTPPATPDPAAPAVATSGAMSGEVRLIGAPANLDLSKHVGHTVAITGSWAPASKADRPTGTTGSEKGMAEAKSFNVKSLAHRSETCK